jgi:hypothetical protein
MVALQRTLESVNISLQNMAHALGGRIRRDRTGPHVVAPGPGCKKCDASLSVWLDGTQIRVHSNRGADWREADGYVRRRCGIPEWTPQRGAATRATTAAPFPVRNMFLSETLKICRHRKRIPDGSRRLGFFRRIRHPGHLKVMAEQKGLVERPVAFGLDEVA